MPDFEAESSLAWCVEEVDFVFFDADAVGGAVGGGGAGGGAGAGGGVVGVS